MESYIRHTLDSLYLEQPLSRISCEFEIKRDDCMIYVWNTDIFETAYDIHCFYKFQVNEITLAGFKKLLSPSRQIKSKLKKTVSFRKYFILWKTYLKKLRFSLKVDSLVFMHLFKADFHLLVRYLQIETHGPWAMQVEHQSQCKNKIQFLKYLFEFHIWRYQKPYFNRKAHQKLNIKTKIKIKSQFKS